MNLQTLFFIFVMPVTCFLADFLPSVRASILLVGHQSIWPVKIEWWGVGMVIFWSKVQMIYIRLMSSPANATATPSSLVQRAFTGFVRFEGSVVCLTMSPQMIGTCLRLIPCWWLQCCADRVVKSHHWSSSACAQCNSLSRQWNSSSTMAWHICFTPSSVGWMFLSASSLS